MNIRQISVLAEVIIYCYGQRLKCLYRNQELLPIPVKKAFYSRHSRHDRTLILSGINVWFELNQQGFPGTSSQWRVRDNAHLVPEVADALRKYYEQNIEHFKLLKASVNAKDQKVIPITTKFEFEGPEEAQMFLEIVWPLISST